MYGGINQNKTTYVKLGNIIEQNEKISMKKEIAEEVVPGKDEKVEEFLKAFHFNDLITGEKVELRVS